MPTELTLGSYIRGARLGYRWLDDPGVFVKIVDTDYGFRLFLAPMGQVPSNPKGPSKQEHHRCWWEGTGENDIRAELSALIRRAVAGDLPFPRLRSPISIDLDHDGDPLPQALPR